MNEDTFVIGTDYHSGYRVNHFRLPGHRAHCGQSENRIFICHLVHLGWIFALRTFRLLQESFARNEYVSIVKHGHRQTILIKVNSSYFR